MCIVLYFVKPAISTDRQTDRQTGYNQYTPHNFVSGGGGGPTIKCIALAQVNK